MESHSSELRVPILWRESPVKSSSNYSKWFWILGSTVIALLTLYVGLENYGRIERGATLEGHDQSVIRSEKGVVAADDGRCSDIGASVLREGGHAVDAAVATALCLGVVNPMSSGIGGGGFMVFRSADTKITEAFDCRETAPLASSQNMYQKNPERKQEGAQSVGVPGELAGLHLAWSKYGRIPWKKLIQPSIALAKHGFAVSPVLGHGINSEADYIFADPGLRSVFAPTGKLLKTGDICYNIQLSKTLEIISEKGMQAFYNGSIGESLVKDVQEAGGILTMKDLQSYKVEVTDALSVDVLGYTVIGMHPPSSGTLGLSFVLNILDSYGSMDAFKGSLGLHRLIESFKHMFAMRMNLGDPKYVDIKKYVSDMLSVSYAERIRKKIVDNTTFDPNYYLNKWSQLRDHGTTHFCIVDTDRNALSMTSTVNSFFGAKIVSPSTGIVLNNEMDDFSTPTENSPDKLPPAPSNFILPSKRPLSSMTPLIILKNNQLAGVTGASGGLHIIPSIVEVLINHFILGMEPLEAIQSPRVYHMLKPSSVLYENFTLLNGKHVEISNNVKLSLMEKGHRLTATTSTAVCQLIVQDLQTPVAIKSNGRKENLKRGVFLGMLTAVSDPRKGGRPASE